MLFVYVKLRNATTPRFAASKPGHHGSRGGVLERVVSRHGDHHLERESGVLWPALWAGAAVVAMVAFSYWLSMI